MYGTTQAMGRERNAKRIEVNHGSTFLLNKTFYCSLPNIQHPIKAECIFGKSNIMRYPSCSSMASCLDFWVVSNFVVDPTLKVELGRRGVAKYWFMFEILHQSMDIIIVQ